MKGLGWERSELTVEKAVIVQLLLVAVIGAAAYTDIRYQKIPNKLALAGLGSGIALHVLLYGLTGAGLALIGAVSGFGIMLVLHLFGAIGAGDVKLFAAIGSLGGLWLTLSIITYSLLFAAVIGVGILIKRRQLANGGGRIIRALFGFIFMRQWSALVPSNKEMIRFPFLLAVVPGLAAALWELYDKGAVIWML
jgi:prepilin peptidase CpaA